VRFPTLAKQHIHRPIVAVHIQASVGRWLSIDALVDTGSDVSLGIQGTPYIILDTQA